MSSQPDSPEVAPLAVDGEIAIDDVAERMQKLIDELRSTGVKTVDALHQRAAALAAHCRATHGDRAAADRLAHGLLVAALMAAGVPVPRH